MSSEPGQFVRDDTRRPKPAVDPIGPLKRIFWGMLICIIDFKLIFRSGGG
jgi:hypothetical protein